MKTIKKQNLTATIRAMQPGDTFSLIGYDLGSVRSIVSFLNKVRNSEIKVIPSNKEGGSIKVVW